MMTESFFADCGIAEDWGSADGYVCGHADEIWGNYMADIGVRDEMIEAIERADLERVAVFRNMDVEEEHRGDGHGRDLARRMLSAFDEHEADLVILFADTEEDNEFDLAAWYERLGFERVDADSEAPCMMIGPEDLIHEIRMINGVEVDQAPAPR